MKWSKTVRQLHPVRSLKIVFFHLVLYPPLPRVKFWYQNALNHHIIVILTSQMIIHLYHVHILPCGKEER